VNTCVQISIWPGGLASNAPGTIAWAGGEIDWNDPDIQKAGYFYATFESVTVDCYNATSGLGSNSGTSYTYSNIAGTNNTVVDGNKVDAATLDGWKTWRALACERCHGAEQEGMVGPSLVEKLQTLKKDEFHDLIMDGRPEKGMPPFNGSAMVTKNWEGLYAYLKGRSDGQIKPGHLYPIEAK